MKVALTTVIFFLGSFAEGWWVSSTKKIKFTARDSQRCRRRPIPSFTPSIIRGRSRWVWQTAALEDDLSVDRLTAEELPLELRERINKYLAVRQREIAARSGGDDDNSDDTKDTEEQGRRVVGLQEGGRGSVGIVSTNTKATSPNAVFDFLGVDPVSKKRKEELAKSGGLGDPLSYGELRRLGFDDLVEPILNMGGYVAVSVALGLEVAPVPVQVEPNWGISLDDEGEDLGLALGDSLEEALARAAEKDRLRRVAKEAAAGGTGLAGREEATRGGPRSGTTGLPEAPARFARVKARPSAEEAEAAAKAAAEAAALRNQPLELGLGQRAWIFAVCAVLAVAWGSTSTDIIAHGGIGGIGGGGLVFPTAAFVDAVNTCREASVGLAIANVACASICVRFAVERRRSVPMWVVKCALAGPTALWELRVLEPLVDSTATAQSPIESLNNGRDSTD